MHYLTGKALTFLHQEGQLSTYPDLSRATLLKRAHVSDMTLQHELEVMSVKAALVSAIRKTESFRTTEFTTWPLLNQFTVRRSTIDPMESGEQVVKPDGFIRIRESQEDGHEFEHSFFLELDRSNETQDKLAQKARCYLEHYRSGGFAERVGYSRSEYKQCPFVVLFVCKSAHRRDNAMVRMLKNDPPTLTQAWLAVFDEVIANPLKAIWMRPRDYRDMPEHERQRLSLI